MAFHHFHQTGKTAPIGRVVDVIFLLDILLETTLRNEPSGHSDYFRTTDLFSVTRPAFIPSLLSLLPYYLLLLIGSISGDGYVPDAFFALGRLPQLNRFRLLKGFFRSMEIAVDVDIRQIAVLKYVSAGTTFSCDSFPFMFLFSSCPSVHPPLRPPVPLFPPNPFLFLFLFLFLFIHVLFCFSFFSSFPSDFCLSSRLFSLPSLSFTLDFNHLQFRELHWLHVVGHLRGVRPRPDNVGLPIQRPLPLACRRRSYLQLKLHVAVSRRLGEVHRQVRRPESLRHHYYLREVLPLSLLGLPVHHEPRLLRFDAGQLA